MSRLIPIGIKDRRLCQALSSIKVESDLDANSNAGVMLSWLQQSLEKMRIQNDTLSGEQLTQNQGACQALQTFFDSLETAQEVLRLN